MNCFSNHLKHFREGRKAILDQVVANPTSRPEISNPYGGACEQGAWWYLGAIWAMKRVCNPAH